MFWKKKNGMKGVLSFFIRPFSHAEIKKPRNNKSQTKTKQKKIKQPERFNLHLLT